MLPLVVVVLVEIVVVVDDDDDTAKVLDIGERAIARRSISLFSSTVQ
jgi:hypothetical protein